MLVCQSISALCNTYTLKPRKEAFQGTGLINAECLIAIHANKSLYIQEIMIEYIVVFIKY